MNKNIFGRFLKKFYKHQILYQDVFAKKEFVNSISKASADCQIKYPFYLLGGKHVSVGSNFIAGPGLRIEAWDKYQNQNFEPQILIGDNVVLNFNVHIGAIDLIQIGNYVLIGSNVLITDHSHGSPTAEELSTPPLLRPLSSKGPTIIEDNVWICEGACILSGVKVGKGAIIGANSVVARDVAAGDVVGGVPARVLKSIRNLNG